jgi:Putative peptidoglycan binding domain
MNYQKLIAVTIALTVCALAGSNVTAHGGGASGHGSGFGEGGFRGGFGGGGLHSGGAFHGSGFRGNRFHHRAFHDRFFFFGDFGDPFFYYPDPYYGSYSYGYDPYDYGYGSYDRRVYQGNAGYTDSLVRQVQFRLARAGYYHGAIDGVSGNATRRAIRQYEHAHNLPADGQMGRLLTIMGLG